MGLVVVVPAFQGGISLPEKVVASDGFGVAVAKSNIVFPIVALFGGLNDPPAAAVARAHLQVPGIDIEQRPAVVAVLGGLDFVKRAQEGGRGPGESRVANGDHVARRFDLGFARAKKLSINLQILAQPHLGQRAAQAQEARRVLHAVCVVSVAAERNAETCSIRAQPFVIAAPEKLVRPRRARVGPQRFVPKNVAAADARVDVVNGVMPVIDHVKTQREAKLAGIVQTIDLARAAFCGSQRGQEKRGKNGNDRDDDEKLNECKCRGLSSRGRGNGRHI